ncbi:23305_t:CDS:2, partial [Gigaspora rosea]
MSKKVQQEVINRYIKRSPNTHFIILGDFNTIIDPDIDKLSKTCKTPNKSLPLHNWLIKNNVADSFRTLNLSEKAFTWSNSSTNIIEMDIFTRSNHDIVSASLDLSHLISNCNLSKIKKNQAKRTNFLYDKAKKDDWNSYSTNLDNTFLNNTKTEYLFKSYTNRKHQTEFIFMENFNITENDKAGTELGKGKKRNRRDPGLNVENDREKYFGNSDEAHFKKENMKMDNEMTKEEKEDFKKFKEYQEEVPERVEKEKLKQIYENIEKCCQMIDGDQGRMIASLLEKPFKCAIDRLIESTNNSRTLISEQC